MTTADTSDAAEGVSSALSVARYEASDATELTLALGSTWPVERRSISGFAGTGEDRAVDDWSGGKALGGGKPAPIMVDWAEAIDAHIAQSEGRSRGKTVVRL